MAHASSDDEIAESPDHALDHTLDHTLDHVLDHTPLDSSSVQAFCRRCGAKAGHFSNAWHQVTNTYFLPALVGSYSSQLRPAGVPKRASTGTELNQW
jgi:hypothetical protein